MTTYQPTSCIGVTLMSESISTDNPFLEELITGLHTIASIATHDPDPRNGGNSWNAERNAYALEAISHGLAAIAYEISQLRSDGAIGEVDEFE